MNTKRIILGLLLITILLSFMIYSYLEYENNDIHIKKYKQIFQNIEQYNNTEISFTVEIININKTSGSIDVFVQERPYNYPHIEINAKNLNINLSTLKKGDLIDIVGIIDGENHIIATKLWIREQWKFDLIYIRSIVAIPFTLYLFFRIWKFNWKKLQFTGRDEHS